MADVIPFRREQSFGKESGPRSKGYDAAAGEYFDLHRYYARFPDQWAAFLRAHFASPVMVAAHFGVTERAAQKWWQGVGGPAGDKIALAFITHPAGAAKYLRAAA